MTGRDLLLTGRRGVVDGLRPMVPARRLALGICYELGHRTPGNRPGFNRGMELGELYTGTWLWGVLAVVLGG